MPKRATVIDEMLEEAVDKKVEKKLEDMFSEGEEESTAERIKEDELKEEHEKIFELDKVIKSTLNDSYHYGKLYKVDPLNPRRPIFLENLQDLTAIDDVETFIQRLAIQKGWEDGLYRIAFFLKNPKSQFESGMRKQLDFNISVPENKKYTETRHESPLNSVRESAELIKTVREAIGATQLPVNPSDPKIIADTFKMGVDAIKNNLPQGQSQNTLEILTALMPLITSLLQRPKESSLLEQIAALKQAGFIPEQKEESGLSSKIVEIALTRLIEGSGGEAPSVGVELVRQLAPAVPGMIDRITGTINNVLQYKNPVMPKTEVSQEKPQQLSQNVPPIFSELLIAAENKNYNYFPKLTHGIGYWLENGDQYLSAILTNEINQEMMSMMLIQYGGEQFNSDMVKDYINKFIDWYKEQFELLLPAEKSEKKEEEKKGEEEKLKEAKIIYIAECDKCKIEYEFETKEEMEKENECEEIINNEKCQGKLKFIKEEKING